MKNLILGAVSFLFVSGASAGERVFDLKLDLRLDGKHVFSPRLQVKEGERGTVAQTINGEQNLIEVIAKEAPGAHGKKGISMSFVISRVDKDGQTTILSQPQIISMPNEKAQISVGPEAGKEAMSLSVVATNL